MKNLYFSLLALFLSFPSFAIGPVTGITTICAYSTTTLSNATAGGSWSSSNTAIATVGSATGIVTGAFGTATVIITYSTSSGNATATVTVNGLPPYIAGPTSICDGSTTTLSNAVAGGTWSSSNTVIASINPLTGDVTGTSAGSSTITYTLSSTGCFSARPLTINPLPTAFTVTGGGSYCSGGTGVLIGLSGSQSGVNYVLYNGASPVGSPVAGSGAAMSFGLQTLAGTYTVGATYVTTTCVSAMTGSVSVTVNPLPVAYTVFGGGSYCAGGTGVMVSLSGSNSGDNYQLYNGSTAVGSPMPGTGTALSFGLQTAAGTYSATATNAVTGCTSNMAGSSTITITSLPVITAGATIACGGLCTLTATGGTTYSWSPATGLSCSTCAVTTIPSPASSITYVVTGTIAACSNTASVTVSGNRISGHITYTGAATDSFRVWLIQYNPIDSQITATDSVISCMDGGIPYYRFDNKPAGSYMVKAKLFGTIPGTSGYIPTYSLSSTAWSSAASVVHASATDVMNITMVYGTVPSGPGFISGNVYFGAGKGTSGEAPAAGMLIYLKNAASGVLTYVYTNAAGAYSFNALAYGDYYVYPEEYDYYTTPSSTITLSAANPSSSGINFKQHTDYGTITPFSVTDINTLNNNTGLNIFPNPASNKLTMQWKNQAIGNANAVITDMLGREVYRSVINMKAVNGQAQLDLGSLNNGLYLITVKSERIYFSSKLMIQK